MIIDPRRAALVLVDLQSRLVPAVAEGAAIAERAAWLAEAAGRLGVPVTVTEQSPAKIGHTVESVTARLPAGTETVAKTRFAGGREPRLGRRLRDLGRDQVVVAGMEAHVCVMQTALSLIEIGCAVFLAEDAIGSRRAGDRDAAIRRMAAAGITPATAEMVVFEWLEQADTPQFRDLLEMIK